MPQGCQALTPPPAGLDPWPAFNAGVPSDGTQPGGPVTFSGPGGPEVEFPPAPPWTRAQGHSPEFHCQAWVTGLVSVGHGAESSESDERGERGKGESFRVSKRTVDCRDPSFFTTASSKSTLDTEELAGVMSRVCCQDGRVPHPGTPPG